MTRSPNRPGLVAVLEWYRQRLTFQRWGNRTPVVVPVAFSGWVLAAPGELADVDGCRPMGAVRADLLALLDVHAGELPRERAAFCAVWGLTEWPDLAVTRPITRRIPVQRRRRDPDGAQQGLTRERVAQLAATMLRYLDTPQVYRPGLRAVQAGPVTDPTRSSWLPYLLAHLDRPPESVLEEAIDSARLFLTLTGTTGAVDPVLAELDRYTVVLRTNRPRLADPRRPVASSRARALVAVAAWQVLHRSHSTAGFAPRRPRADPAGSGVLRPPPGFTPIAPVVARLLEGDVSSEVLIGCCDEVHRLATGDPGAAAVVADLLLARYPLPGRPAVDADVSAMILQTTIRLRSAHEDWTAVALVYLMTRRHPRSHRTVDALMYAIAVATAHSRWSIAEDLLRRMEGMLVRGITVPTGRSVPVETVEYRMWAWHQRTGTARRRLQELGQRAAPSAPRRALAEQSQALSDLDRALALNETIAPGDANEVWRHVLLVRLAELHLAASDLHRGADADVERRRAERALDAAAVLQHRVPALALNTVAYRKVLLSIAIRGGDDDHAARLLDELHQVDHWPLHRSVPEVSQVAAGRRNRLVGPRLRAAVAELMAAERDSTWRAAVDPANRNRRARAG